MKPLTVLVTGATGFLGSHILEKLISSDHLKVIAACRNPLKLLSDFSGEVRAGDLTDKTYIEQLTRNVDVICHAAAWTSLWGHRKDEQRLYLEPTKALIDSAIASGVKRFIFDSSVVAAGVRRDGSPVKDDVPGKHPRIWPHMDIVVDIEDYMHQQSLHGMEMVTLRCGHFAGKRYNLGLLSILIPRLRTHLVPWVAGANARVPIVDGADLAMAFALAIDAKGLKNYQSFNVCGPSFPRMREIIDFLHEEIALPRPHFGVPLWAAYSLGWLLEKLSPIVPGDPFLTRSIVFLGEDWYAPSDLAKTKLNYEPKISWQTALRNQLQDMERQGYPKISLVDRMH